LRRDIAASMNSRPFVAPFHKLKLADTLSFITIGKVLLSSTMPP
jgi:hypothetical protein